MKKILTIIGTRPEVIKMSSLLPRFDEQFEHYLIHSGQHFSPEMDKIFFEEMGLRAPHINLKAAGLLGTHQIGEMINRLAPVFDRLDPDAVVVHGDTNTTLAGAIATKKNHKKDIKLIHIEAGARSGNFLQQEEINRVIVDRVSDLLFASSEGDLNNLLSEGIPKDRCRLTGNTIIEVCSRASKMDGSISKYIKGLIEGDQYIVLTLHRQETVESYDKLKNIFDGITRLSNKIKVVFPAHPRTKNCIKKFKINIPQGVQIIDPVGYIDMIQLVKGSFICITDSGGLQEEASYLRVPTLVVRDETEYMRYVEAGLLQCIGTDGNRLFNIASQLLAENNLRERLSALPINFNCNVSNNIISEISEVLNCN